jgi:hypothetical protein
MLKEKVFLGFLPPAHRSGASGTFSAHAACGVRAHLPVEDVREDTK